jgi:hypothetical protein
MNVYALSTGIQLSNNGILKEKSISGNIELTIRMGKPTDTEYFCTWYNSFPGEFMVRHYFFYFYKGEKSQLFFCKKICIVIFIFSVCPMGRSLRLKCPHRKVFDQKEAKKIAKELMKQIGG